MPQDDPNSDAKMKTDDLINRLDQILSDKTVTSVTIIEEKLTEPIEKLDEDTSKSKTDDLINKLDKILNEKKDLPLKELCTNEDVDKKLKSPIVDFKPFKPEFKLDMSTTLSSIENSIKAIDDFCERESDIKSKRINKTLDNLEKSLSKFKIGLDNPPLLLVHDLDDEMERAYHIRGGRDKKRTVSPRRAKDEEREERQSVMRRSKSPICHQISDEDTSPGNRMTSNDYLNLDNNKGISSIEIYGTLGRKSSSKKFDSSYNMPSAPSISTMSTTATSSSKEWDYSSDSSFSYYNRSSGDAKVVHRMYPDKLEIRESTVTATMYDRYLYYKKEQSSRIDKSPSSPSMITRSYLDSLRPTSSSSNLSVSARTSKSAENSPSRFTYDAPVKSPTSNRYSFTPYYSGHHTLTSSFSDSSYRKSCDNLHLPHHKPKSPTSPTSASSKLLDSSTKNSKLSPKD